MSIHHYDQEPFNPDWDRAVLAYWREADPDQRQQILRSLVAAGDTMHRSWEEVGPIILGFLKNWMKFEDLARVIPALAKAPIAVAKPMLDAFLFHFDPGVRRAAAWAWVNHHEHPAAPAELLADDRQEVVLQHLIRSRGSGLEAGKNPAGLTSDERAALETLTCWAPFGYQEMNLLVEADCYLPAARQAVIRYVEAEAVEIAGVPQRVYCCNSGLMFLSRGPEGEAVAQGLSWCRAGRSWLGPALLGLAGVAGQEELEPMAEADNDDDQRMALRGLAVGPSDQGERVLRGWLGSSDPLEREEGIKAMALRSAWDPAAFAALLAMSTRYLVRDPEYGIGDDSGPFDFFPALCWSGNGPFWTKDWAELDDLELHFLPREYFETDCPGVPRRELLFYRAALGLAAHADPWVSECATMLLAARSPDRPWWRSFWETQLHSGRGYARGIASSWLVKAEGIEVLEPHRAQILSAPGLDLPFVIKATPASPARAAWLQDFLAHPSLAVRLKAVMAFRDELDGEVLAGQTHWVREALASVELVGFTAHVLAWVPVPGLAQDLRAALDRATSEETKIYLAYTLKASPDLEAHDLLLTLVDRPEGFLRSLLPKLVEGIGGDWAVQALSDLLDHPQPPNGTGAALGRMGTPASLAALLAHMNVAAGVRAQVAEGLGRHPAEEGWAALKTLLEDPVFRVRRAAIRSLAYSKRPEVRDLLMAKVLDWSPRIRQAAAWVLCRLPGETVLEMVRIGRRLHPEPWPPAFFPELNDRFPKAEAYRVAELLVRHVHHHAGLP